MAPDPLSPPRPQRSRRWDAVALAFVLGGMAAALWLNRAGLRDVLATLDWSWLWPLAWGLFALQMALTGSRSILLLGPSLPARPGVRLAALRCHALAQASNTLLPSMAGDVVVKAGCLNGLTGLGWGRLSGLMLVDRAIDVTVAAALAPVALLYMSGTVDLPSSLGLAAVALIAAPAALATLLHRIPAPAAAPPAASRGDGSRLGPQDPATVRGDAQIRGMVQATPENRPMAQARPENGRLGWKTAADRAMAVLTHLGALYRSGRRRLLGAYGITLLRYVCYGGVLTALGHAVLGGTDAGAPAIPVMAFGIALAQLALVLPIAPGGIGVQEGAWVAILTASGHPLADALAFAVAFRVFLLAATALTTVPILAWQPNVARENG